VVFDGQGRIVDDGTGRGDVPFDEQVHLTFKSIREALAVAGATFDDVVDCQVWLADARDFVRFNAIYRAYFKKDPPVRSVFPTGFMFNVKIEMKVVAYKPAQG
jgi:enamine deaminase RidA (YjgF/YER057c/UK114 family)